jgi:hypothetical protein
MFRHLSCDSHRTLCSTSVLEITTSKILFRPLRNIQREIGHDTHPYNEFTPFPTAIPSVDQQAVVVPWRPSYVNAIDVPQDVDQQGAKRNSRLDFN